LNGIHDLGGMHGFGHVEREENEPVFHAPWERTMVAIQRGLGGRGVFSIDEFRHGIERMDPAHYLASSYYEHWLDGISRILIEKGTIAADELETRTAFFQDRTDAPATAALTTPPIGQPRRDRVGPRTTEREATAPPRFAVGDRVITRALAPRGHTRLPRYARGKLGVIERLHGVHVFPDTNAHGLGEQPQPLFSVRFDARELWGDSAEPNQSVNLDLWESYLQPAPVGYQPSRLRRVSRL
jgi:nitrile hydratase beta subunit